mmetsp:Transcript_56290/g.134159  ORF Transcript_56290/g.134159 Transcript_56290/m.134159 type:complete len:302 (-) Transcript_56290:563-1468(-)
MVPDESQSGGIAPGYDVQAAAAAVAVEGALDASCAVAPGVPAADASGGSMQARIEAFCTSYGLNSEAQGVIERLVPEAQETVMTQFSPKGVQPGSYEMNGKLIMFARNVERGYKGGGKGKGKDAGKGYAAPPAAACGVSPPPPPCMGGGYAPSPMGGGCMPSNGCPPAPCGCQGGCGGWDGWSQGGCGYGGCDYSWGGCKGGYDWGKGGCGGGGGYGAWGKGDYGKGGGGCDYSQSWGMPPAPPPAMGGGYGMGGGMDYGCGGGGCCDGVNLSGGVNLSSSGGEMSGGESRPLSCRRVLRV